MYRLPESARTALDIAGVMPVMIEGLNRRAWLSPEATSGGREVLMIRAELSPVELDEIADWALSVTAARLHQADQQ